MIRLIACIAVLLTACASSPRMSYDDALAAWWGVREADLLRIWGQPASRSDAGGRRYIVFDRRMPLQLPGDTGQAGSAPPMSVSLHCITTFELDDGRVSGWSSRGNHCTTAPAAPATPAAR